MNPIWILSEIVHEKAVFFHKDPYFYNSGKKRLWLFKFHFKGSSLSVRGEPLTGSGEAYGLFSFYLDPLENSHEKTGFRAGSSLDFLDRTRFVLAVEDIFVSPKGAHIGSYIFNKVLKFIRLTVLFCGKAEIKGFLGAANEITPERVSRREGFWKSFGVNLDHQKRRLTGDLKIIVDRHIKELPDVIEIPFETILRPLKEIPSF